MMRGLLHVCGYPSLAWLAGNFVRSSCVLVCVIVHNPPYSPLVGGSGAP